MLGVMSSRRSLLCRRKGGVNVVGGEMDDPLGLDVESHSKIAEDQLMVSHFGVLRRGGFKYLENNKTVK